MFKKGKGFTLIELLVVIAIIAILAVIILAALNQARKSARDAKRKETVRNVMTAIETYNSINTSDELDASGIEDLVNTINEDAQYLPAYSADNTEYGYITKATADGEGGYCIVSDELEAKTNTWFYATTGLAEEASNDNPC